MPSLAAGSGGFQESGTRQGIHRILFGQKSPQDPGIFVRNRHRRSVYPILLVNPVQKGSMVEEAV